MTAQSKVTAQKRPGLFGGLSQARLDELYGYLFIAPQMIGFFIFVIGPLIAVFVYSFQDRNLLTGQVTFVGLQNFVEMFTRDKLFSKVVFNSLLFTFGLVPLNVVLSLGLAAALTGQLRGTTVFRTIYFAPVVTSAVAWAIVWKFMLQNESGTVNQYLALIGIDGPNWLREPAWAMTAVIVTRAIKNIGLNLIIFMAALASLPKSYTEAALVDGANSWQIFRRITLPLLAPTTLMVVIITVIGSLKVFDHIVLLTGGGPANATLVLVNYIYLQGFQFFETGYASALAVVLFLVTLVLTLLQWSMRRRFVYHEQ
ncbi:MAG: sugar ABC transporter permease [Caldilineaceae bacterium]|nr:sugar ABC transporter permease [Caldilineaceae bacterium]MBP8110121.1 sugar ABC transporter permease [Caldilineaceae bacterium]MBP8124991.1 sugar ABC transporter permease [Caldilineaceae bacterium]